MIHKCSFCNKSFKKETTLQTHMCEQKRRHFNRNDKEVKAGYTTYLYWNFKNSAVKKDISYSVFSKSKLYLAFVKFGKYIIQNNITDWEIYIDWLSKNQIKIDDWAKDRVYGTYCNERIKKETPERAVERYVLFAQKWEEKTTYKWHMFWELNSVFDTIQLISDGKISPWILFCDPQAQKFIDTLPDELIVKLDSAINLSYWKTVVEKNREDSKWITQLLTV